MRLYNQLNDANYLMGDEFKPARNMTKWRKYNFPF